MKPMHKLHVYIYIYMHAAHELGFANVAWCHTSPNGDVGISHTLGIGGWRVAPSWPATPFSFHPLPPIFLSPLLFPPSSRAQHPTSPLPGWALSFSLAPFFHSSSHATPPKPYSQPTFLFFPLLAAARSLPSPLLWRTQPPPSPLLRQGCSPKFNCTCQLHELFVV